MKKSINNDAYLLTCNCPDCGVIISRGYKQETIFCYKCGIKLQLPAFTKKEIDKALDSHSLDNYEDL